ncbi:MAG: oligoendopeptidase F [Chloroflexi bacterium]|nr:oligoendopeptidase F [Chloroflexota bacterium]MCY4248756.1 oligoendopeptidase F [Chloroflexota bacterium]
MTTIPARADIPKETTWNHESVFASFDDWRAEYSAVSRQLGQIAAFQGRLAESAERLAEYLDCYQALARRVWTLYMYTAMWQACDGENEAIKGMLGQAQGLAGQFLAGAAFAQPELLAMAPGTLLQWAQSEPAMQQYEHYIDDLLRKKRHVLSAEVEGALGLLNDPLGRIESIRSALNDMDLRFDDATDASGAPQPLIQSTRDKLLGESDRLVRQSAWQNYADSYLRFHNTFATTYLASVKSNVVQARLRGYDSVLQAKLSPGNIPQAVFHNLIDTCQRHIPTWHRYWDVRRRALGYETIHPWDIWAPLTSDDPQLSFAEAVDMIAAGMRPLGDAYVETMRRGCMQERWVDHAINRGKSEGAFSYGTYDTHPFIMLSFDGKLGAMSTLAHELGHSMHSYYSRRHQPFVYSSYSMFAAEVASNFNQALVRAHLFAQNTDRAFQLALIQEAMDNIHRYFFIMPTLARFELEVHTRMENDEPLTPAALNEIMAGLFAEGYGETMTDDPRRTGITWAQFGHLYEAFYTFQYATGISAAHALANVILADESGEAVGRYLAFLRAGGSQYPIAALQRAGVDMSTPAAVEETFAVLSGLVDRLEGLI